MNKVVLALIVSFLLVLGFKGILAAQAISVSVTTDKDVYYQYEMVYITVTVTSDGSPVAGEDVGIQVLDPDGFTVYTDQGKTDNNGEVIFYFRLNPNAKCGEYTIIATVTGGEGEGKFRVVPRAIVGGEVNQINKLELLPMIIANNINLIVLIVVAVLAIYIVFQRILENNRLS